MYHSIPHIDEENNKFYVGLYGREIVIPVASGCYEIENINKYIKNALGDED
jgi:hypothetical protein